MGVNKRKRRPSPTLSRMEDVHLIEQIAVALGFGLAGGLLARLAGLSPIVGYLAAGIAIGPFTPGYVGDMATLNELADIGVIFLMFGVGLHFSLRDLMAVRRIAVPGAVLQMALIVLAGTLVGVLFSLDWRESAVLGLALSISSTVVMVRALEERGILSSVHGQVCVGWLVVQDLATVLFLAVLPAMAEGSPVRFAGEAGAELAKAAVFLAVMLFAGARLMPWLLALVVRVGSRELFILAVVASALGVAAGAAAVGLSVALGAFVGGVVVGERETSHQVAADVVPLREAFAVLFFVAIGMLLDPAVLRDHPGLVAAAVAVVIVGKGLVTAILAATFPYPAHTALVAGAGLAQVGEFSFIIARQGLDTGLITESTYNVVLATAVISITLNPVAFGGISALERLLRAAGPLWNWANHQGSVPQPVELSGHVVVAGYGRVGQLTGHSLQQIGIPFNVIDADLELVRRLSHAQIPAIWGDAATAEVLATAGLARARLLAVCVPDGTSALLAITNARKLNPTVPIVVRARDADEIALMRSLGVKDVVVPEYEGGLELMRQVLVALGFESEEALHFSHAVRDIHYGDAL
jgi:monovalent cation:H+ antiporter-2, CPA2 family